MNVSTVAAISTPYGKGGVAVLRISGAESLRVAERVFRPKTGKKVSQFPPRFQIYGEILSSDGERVLDDGLLTYFAAPHSFTGEDVVEIACHGGVTVTAMVLSSILECGAEPAPAGEFSRRSFLNGKMTLTAAEGVADLLDARTEDAAYLSSAASRGKLSARIGEISDLILAASSSLWAYLDYPEEDLQTMDDSALCQSLSEIAQNCLALIDSYKTGRAVSAGVPSAIVGKPNVGKSSFFNALLGEEKAIVTEIPGTTRDVIEYPVKAGRVLLNLADTAGVRADTADKVERIGVERAITTLEESGLVFALFDRSRPLDENDDRILKTLGALSEETVVIPVVTKTDLAAAWDAEKLPLDHPFLYSSVESTSLLPLFDRVEEAFVINEKSLLDGHVLTNARQKTQLVKTRDLVLRAITEVNAGAKDLASLTLEEALSTLLETDGKAAGEMILDQVFSRFCVGK